MQDQLDDIYHNGVEGWKTWNEIQRILKRMLVDTMRKIREENK